MYRPTTSVTFATSSGSAENLNVSSFHGFTPYFFQIPATVVWSIPSRGASSRDDQWVTPRPAGGGVNVAEMTFASSTVFGRPGRFSSLNPAIPRSAYRDRHRFTVGRDIPTSSAIW